MSRAMSTPADLPIELILLAAEYAVWNEFHRQAQTSDKAIRIWRQWVASLCTVCRAFEPAMSRILYTLVHIYPGNIDAVQRAADMDRRPFRRARAVYFEPWITDLQFHAPNLRDAFQRVRAYTGPFDYLHHIETHSIDFRPLSVSVPAPYDLLNPVLVRAERLRFTYAVGCIPRPIADDDLSRFRTKFLIVDISTHNLFTDTGLDELLDMLSQLLRIPTLERIIIHPTLPSHADVMSRFRFWVRWLARTLRSTIIWWDDSFPSRGEPYTGIMEMRIHHGLFEAIKGDDLWLQGCQMYFPDAEDSEPEA
ncbi:hypothetical protein EXIGLDRAFT_248429 [Exidia glandulosa HHB12029]|uniref:F-box domain-containing protein n=1 Tax=Exidia glandulosa HHB12029 TaxID=1314781 RepID=A0A165QC72_EXIGL|nr:hypothetical protein EXIGLDRAFT_248429 [Exidia glandulosa HHB12029]